MKRRIPISVAIGATLMLGAFLIVRQALEPPDPLRAQAVAFELADVTIVNPGHERLEHQNVSVSHGTIRGITALRKEGGALREYRGMYVLPGLIDMHSHQAPDNPLHLTSYFSLLNLAHGVTTIRAAADVDGTAARAQREADGRGYPRPRVFSCDAFVSAGKRKWANTILLASPRDADRAVSKLKANGATCVKAYDGLTLPMVQALRTAADKYHLALMGHVPEALRYEEALLPDVQHLMGIAPKIPGRHLYLSDGWDKVDDARLLEIVRVSKEHGIANTPTLVLGQQLLLREDYAASRETPDAQMLPRLFRDLIWHPSKGVPQYRGLTAEDFARLRIAQRQKLRLVRMLYDAGLQLYLGTDVQQPFVVPGRSLQQEMRLFVEAGVPLESVWEIATRQSGAALGGSMLGTIVVDAPADLLIFRDDPTRDLRALNSLQAVVSQGRLYTRAALDRKIAEYRAHYAGAIFDQVSMVLAAIALRKVGNGE